MTQDDQQLDLEDYQNEAPICELPCGTGRGRGRGRVRGRGQRVEQGRGRSTIESLFPAERDETPGEDSDLEEASDAGFRPTDQVDANAQEGNPPALESDHDELSSDFESHDNISGINLLESDFQERNSPILDTDNRSGFNYQNGREGEYSQSLTRGGSSPENASDHEELDLRHRPGSPPSHNFRGEFSLSPAENFELSSDDERVHEFPDSPAFSNTQNQIEHAEDSSTRSKRFVNT